MNVENIMVSELRQTGKDWYVISLYKNVKKMKLTNCQRIGWWSSGAGRRGKMGDVGPKWYRFWVVK